jgi:hypothetical protein
MRVFLNKMGAMSSTRYRLRRSLVWLRRNITRRGRQPTVPTPTPSSTSRADPPLSPAYPFNDPGPSIVLHDGPISGPTTNDVPGIVELSCVPELNLAWRITQGADTWIPTGEVTLLLRRPDGDVRLPGAWRGSGEGWSNGAEIGKADAPLKRLVAHWFNLPDFHARLGRWETESNGWKVTLDVRPDHDRVWTDLDKAHIYVMTHVMELRRADEATFTATEAEPMLTALHVGVSFALGRWAAPVLPVGEGANGEVVWQSWRVPHCDPARETSPGWWYQRQHAFLADFLDRVIKAFADPDRLSALRLQMMLGISAINARGFVEQRVMMGAAGLEHIMWQILVLGGRMTEDQYRRRDRYQGRLLDAHDLLRMVLKDAKIPTDIDAQLLPVIATFVADERAQHGAVLDGPRVVTQIRNRLVHPKAAQERVYRLDGLVAEVWLLTRHYLVLLILHSLGYRGSYRDLRKLHGLASEVDEVPWAARRKTTATTVDDCHGE